MQIARELVEKAIDEQMDGSLLPDPGASKNPSAVVLGGSEELKVGRPGPEHLTAKERHEIATKAAAAGWNKKTSR